MHHLGTTSICAKFYADPLFYRENFDLLVAQKEKSKVFPVSHQSRLKSATLNLKHYTFALKDLQQLDAACYVHVLCGPVLFIFVTKTFL